MMGTGTFHPEDYPRSYRIPTWQRVMGYAGGAGIALYSAIKILSDADNADMPLLIYVALIVIGILSCAQAFLFRVTLYADGIEIRRIYRTYKFQRNDIYGTYDSGHYNIYLALSQDGKKRFIISPNVKRDDAFKRWILSFTDMRTLHTQTLESPP
ncbi:MAG: hypothetical protein OXT65_01180 [Alphaproteobacteria bacterium]|nr:hypothetical protein [Alphaproteobacteria bacterium]